jgi:hypothetical protein
LGPASVHNRFPLYLPTHNDGAWCGHRLGAYEIVGLLGAGGMGEVHRARDTRRGRNVAIKSLPDVFRADPERAARFDREARLLASLDQRAAVSRCQRRPLAGRTVRRQVAGLVRKTALSFSIRRGEASGRYYLKRTPRRSDGRRRAWSSKVGLRGLEERPGAQLRRDS